MVNVKVLNYERFRKETGLEPKVPTPDDLAQMDMTKCKTMKFRPLSEEEWKLRGIGEIHEEKRIPIKGPYDSQRPRVGDAEIHRPLTWRRLLFCGFKGGS